MTAPIIKTVRVLPTQRISLEITPGSGTFTTYTVAITRVSPSGTVTVPTLAFTTGRGGLHYVDRVNAALVRGAAYSVTVTANITGAPLTSAAVSFTCSPAASRAATVRQRVADLIGTVTIDSRAVHVLRDYFGAPIMVGDTLKGLPAVEIQPAYITGDAPESNHRVQEVTVPIVIYVANMTRLKESDENVRLVTDAAADTASRIQEIVMTRLQTDRQLGLGSFGVVPNAVTFSAGEVEPGGAMVRLRTLLTVSLRYENGVAV